MDRAVSQDTSVLVPAATSQLYELYHKPLFVLRLGVVILSLGLLFCRMDLCNR